MIQNFSMFDMSKPVGIALMIIFSIHFVVFLRCYLKSRRRHHLYLAGAFIWLILYQITRLWWFEATLFGFSAQNCFRLAAWMTTGVGALLYLRFKWISMKNP